MIKKKILMLLVVCMTLGICACSKSNVNSKDEVLGQVTDIKEDTQITEDSANIDETKIEVPEWLYFPYKNIYFGYTMMLPSDACRDAGYGSECWIDGASNGEIVYITHYAGEIGDEYQKENIDMSTYNSSEDIFDLLVENFIHEYALGYDYELVDYNIEIIKTEEINDLEMTKFQGDLNAKHESTGEVVYTFPVVAYGIQTEKTPVLVCCLDRTVVDSEGESTHEEWITKIDDIVATFEE